MDDDKKKMDAAETESQNEFVEASKMRRAVPQILASSAKNLILFDNGLVLSFSTIAIAALLNAHGPMSFDNDQASWFASITYLCQPVGSVLAGIFMEPLGRKKSMLLLNLPFLTAWILLYFAPNVATMYAAGAIMGLAVGCTEAPILTYVGEISEPWLRGVMTCYAQLFGALAYVVLYIAGSHLSWRMTAIVCSAIPVITFICITQVPETPAWLLSKGRVKDAEDSLRWLRGWVTPAAVRKELDDLIAHHNESTASVAANSHDHRKGRDQDEGLANPAFSPDPDDRYVPPSPVHTTSSTESGLVGEELTLLDKIKYLATPGMRRPLTIIVFYFFFFYASGFPCIRPYLVPLFRRFNITMDPYNATVIVSVMGLVGNAVCMCAVHYCGKRVITFIAFFGSAFSTLGLGLVALGGILSDAWALPCFLAMAFFNGLGPAPIPWMLQSELFPFRGRSIGSSVAAALSYLIGFVATKTFLSSEEALTLPGVFYLYTLFSFIAFIYLAIYLPETEGKSLHEIEDYFKSKQKQQKVESSST